MKRHTFMSDGYYAISGEENFDDQDENYCGAAIDKLAEYENLEEQGRLIVLPCKVGDNFFTCSWICSASDYDYQRECEKYNECNECPYNSYEIKEWTFKNAIHILNAEEAFGKSIFLSREEAEAAISSN